MTATLTLICVLTLTLNQPLQQSERHGPFTVRVHASARTITLSDSVIVTLELIGPSPLVVREAEPLLDTPGWSAEAVTPPQLTQLADPPSGPAGQSEPGGQRGPGGPGDQNGPSRQERWTRTYRLEPELTGTPNPIQLRPLRVRDGVQEREIAWPSLPVTVTTQIPTPHIDQLRPISDIEPPAEANTANSTVADSSSRVGALVGGLIVTLLVVIGVGVWWYRRWRRGQESTPAEWALARLAVCPDPEAALAVLREYLHRRYALPAQAMTASELAQAETIPSQSRARLGSLLVECETTRYAGQTLPAEVLLQVQQWIESDTAEKLDGPTGE